MSRVRTSFGRSFALAVICFELVMPAQAGASLWLERLVENSYLIDVRDGTRQSQRAEALVRGGYELQNGEWLSFDKWYTPRWTEVRFDFMTQLTPTFGILWGVSTGERAQKYTISPGLKLGAIFQIELGPNATIAFLATHLFRNRLREKTCQADYGDIGGGVLEVNCRLAASPISPEESFLPG